jgi:hypothetical protein
LLDPKRLEQPCAVLLVIAAILNHHSALPLDAQHGSGGQMSLSLQPEMTEDTGRSFENPVKASPSLFNFVMQRERALYRSASRMPRDFRSPAEECRF